jgi:uncharacterized protein YecA (UPF0149 family)
MAQFGIGANSTGGYLAAIIIAPPVVMPSQWLPWLWDESCPHGSSKKFKKCCGSARDAVPSDAIALH